MGFYVSIPFAPPSRYQCSFAEQSVAEGESPCVSLITCNKLFSTETVTSGLCNCDFVEFAVRAEERLRERKTSRTTKPRMAKHIKETALMSGPRHGGYRKKAI